MRHFLPQFIIRRRSSWPTWGAVLLIVAIACQPLLDGPPRGHDALLHYYRIPAVSELWRNGIFFSRWTPDLIYGYGSPLFNFYPPLSAYLLTALYWLVGQNGPLAYSLSYALALALSAVSMFLLGRRLFGDGGGLLASAAYTWSPHLLLQTYSRGSLSNALALALAPLAALALLRVSRRPTGPRVALAALIVALLLASHTAAGLLFVPVLILFTLAASRLLRHSPGAQATGALLLGLALGAFIWLPALAEIDVTRYAASVGAGSNFGDHFAAVLAWPPQTIARLAKTPLPHSVGVAQLLLGAGAVFVASFCWRRRREWPAAPAAPVAILAGLAGLVALFFATPASTWFWAHVQPLRQLQFPWRLLDLPVFLLALSLGWWAGALRARWRPWLVGAAMVLMFLNALPYVYPARMAALPEQPTLADATRVQQTHGIMGLTAWGEYSSDDVERWPGGPPFPGADRGASLVEKLRLPRTVQLRAARGGLLHATWELTVPAPVAAILSVHYFPGWDVKIDGANAPVTTDRRGRMHISVPAGSHELSVNWTRTPVRWLADGLSLLALAICALLVLPRGALARFRRIPGLGDLPAWQGSPPAAGAAPSPVSRTRLLWALPLLATLLLAKVVLFDAANTPLVVHPEGQQIPGVTRPAHGDFGAFRLSGFEREDPGELTLYWYAPRQVQVEYTVRLTIADAAGAPVHEIENPYPGDNLTTGWGPGLVVRDEYDLPLDELPAPGAYTLSVAVLDSESGEPLPTLDGPAGAATVGVGAIVRPPLPVAIPPQARALDAHFAGAIDLTHVQAPQRVQRGEPFPLTLFWASRGPVDRDYTVFVHLLRPDGAFVAAYDGEPRDGLYPTSAWTPGEIIADPRQLTLDVPPGEYLLRAGLYDLDSGERLPLSGKDAGAGDGVTVQALTILR